jgi:hypothetical protein
MSKDTPKKIDEPASIRELSDDGCQRDFFGSINIFEEKVDLINSKLGFDKDYTWFKVSQGLFTTMWLGVSRTNVTILNKDKTEEIGNYTRSEFTVLSSTSNR